MSRLDPVSHLVATVPDQQVVVQIKVDVACLLHSITAAVPLDYVVTGVANENVVTASAQQTVVVGATVKVVVAGTAVDHVVTSTTLEHIVAGSASQVVVATSTLETVVPHATVEMVVELAADQVIRTVTTTHGHTRQSREVGSRHRRDVDQVVARTTLDVQQGHVGCQHARRGSVDFDFARLVHRHHNRVRRVTVDRQLRSNRVENRHHAQQRPILKTLDSRCPRYPTPSLRPLTSKCTHRLQPVGKSH